MPDNAMEAQGVSPRLREWLMRAATAGASDVHIIAGYPPVMRLHGCLTPLEEFPLDAPETESLVRSLCSAETIRHLDERKNLDFSMALEDAGVDRRFRANLFVSGGIAGACLRVIPPAIPDFEWAGFPFALAQRLASLRDGLVIVTGVAGSGKTTSLAMIVNLLNQSRGCRIITVEDPVEYVFPKVEGSLVTQRELGGDVVSFAEGLKSGLRQDPDVILVGEIRDRETAQMALSAAETGHLVFTTLHTRDAKGAISRYADLFPQDVQGEIRSQLAFSLRTVISQRLLPGTQRGARRHLALEVLWNTHPIANGIRIGKLESIDNYLLTHRDNGMVSFDESVRQLLRAGKITRETAEQNVREVSLLDR